MNEYTEQLEKRIADLEIRLNKRDSNQVQLPLDPISQSVLSALAKGKVIIPLQTVSVTGGAGGSVTIPSQTVKVIS